LAFLPYEILWAFRPIGLISFEPVEESLWSWAFGNDVMYVVAAKGVTGVD
jgi:hypothetical protein